MDTNVLIYADDASGPFYARARDILNAVLSNARPACISPQILGEYYAVMTSARRGERPLAPQEAVDRIRLLLRKQTLRKLHPKRGTMGRALDLCRTLGVRGPRLFDVYYARTLLDHGVTRIVTGNAKHFSGIPGLTVENPFA